MNAFSIIPASTQWFPGAQCSILSCMEDLVPVIVELSSQKQKTEHKYTHTHIYMCIYIYIYKLTIGTLTGKSEDASVCFPVSIEQKGTEDRIFF